MNLAAVLLVTAIAAPEDSRLTRQYEHGPVRATVEVSPVPARLSDLPRLVLTIDADESVEVTLPMPAGELGGFAARTLKEPHPETKDGRRIVALELELEPLESGTIVFPALDVDCVDRRPQTLAEHPDGLAFTVSTEPLEIEVTSLVGVDAPSLDRLKPPLPPLRVESTARIPWGWILGAAIALIAATVALVLMRRKKIESVPVGPPPTPEELARREFVALVNDDPLARGALSAFYSELTLIVRRYIERTTGVAAPEQTTEEFLRAMRGHVSFDASSREKLKSFLESADLVKFAGVRPQRSDVEESFRRGQEFAGQKQPIALRTTEAAS